MKRNFTVRLPKACTEDWDTFDPKEEGRHCKVCSKVVVDFTRMTDNDIIAYLSTHSERICGRLGHRQLKTYTVGSDIAVRPGFGLVKAGVISLLLVLTSRPIHAKLPEPVPVTIVSSENYSEDVPKAYVLTGQVVSSEDGEPFPGVNVTLKGTKNGTVTDSEGRFKIGPVEPGQVLVVSFIGYKTFEYVVPETQVATLKIELTADALFLGEVIVGELNVDETLHSAQASNSSLWDKVKNVFRKEPKNQ